MIWLLIVKTSRMKCSVTVSEVVKLYSVVTLTRSHIGVSIISKAVIKARHKHRFLGCLGPKMIAFIADQSCY